jgi:hypothetical protein
MIIIVSGWRFCSDRWFIISHLDEIQRQCKERDIPITKLVQGGARGVDAHAKYWAEMRDIEHEEERADWKAYGIKAGPIRNATMLQKYDISLVIAFLHSESKGTRDMIRQAKNKGIQCKIIPLDQKAWDEINHLNNGKDNASNI